MLLCFNCWKTSSPLETRREIPKMDAILMSLLWRWGDDYTPSVSFLLTVFSRGNSLPIASIRPMEGWLWETSCDFLFDQSHHGSSGNLINLDFRRWSSLTVALANMFQQMLHQLLSLSPATVTSARAISSTQEMVKWIKKNHPNVQAALEKTHTRSHTSRCEDWLMEINWVLLFTPLYQSDLGREVF